MNAERDIAMKREHEANYGPNKDSESASLGWVLLNEKHIRYDIFVQKLWKKESPELNFAHAAMGITGEAGELCDAIKKHIIYGRELDINNVIEELGDLRFYMQALMNIVGISEQQILQHNALKLAQRYEGLQYSNEAAIARKDKAGE